MSRGHAMRSIVARRMLIPLVIAFCAVTIPAASAEQEPTVNHNLAVTLDLANHRLKVHDRIQIPGALVTAPLTISLNADLHVQRMSGGLKPVPTGAQAPDSGTDRDHTSHVPVNVYRVEGATPGQELTGELDYEGIIDYPVQDPGSEYARAFSESPG